MGPRRPAGRAQWPGLRGARRTARQESVPLPSASRYGRVVLRRVRRRRISVWRHGGPGSHRRHRRRACRHASASAPKYWLQRPPPSRHFDHGRGRRRRVSRFQEDRRRRGRKERRLQDRNLCRPRPHRADRLLRWRRWLTRGLETITDLNPSYPIGGSVLAPACVRTGRFPERDEGSRSTRAKTGRGRQLKRLSEPSPKRRALAVLRLITTKWWDGSLTLIGNGSSSP